MAVSLTVDDLTPFAPTLGEDKADIMIADALALAAQVAPCVFADDFDDATKIAAAKAILRGAILRWNDQGTGEQAQLTAGVFGFAPKGNQRSSLLFPSEINDLAALCSTDGNRRKAYMIDTLPTDDAEE